MNTTIIICVLVSLVIYSPGVLGMVLHLLLRSINTYVNVDVTAFTLAQIPSMSNPFDTRVGM